MNDKTAAIIAAAGAGKRMGSGIPKQYLKIGGEPILLKTVRAFCQNEAVDYIFIAINGEYRDYCSELLQSTYMEKEIFLVEGGEQRQDSVYKALKAVKGYGHDIGYVLIHDGARPFIKQSIIHHVLDATKKTGAAIAAVLIKDSVRRETGSIDRAGLYAVQTPQGFELDEVIKAYESAYAQNYIGTDDASVVERTGKKIQIVPGDYDNLKITTKEDLPMEVRIGTGYDVHTLVKDRKLILGGVEIPFEKGLFGHSDADVLLHAVMDALLGAAALGDIGEHFSDSDPDYEGISSVKLLEKVQEMIQKEGYTIGNIDVTLIAQKPKIAPHITAMRARIAKALKIAEGQISIKGTTTERLGFVGREEGIAAQAVCVLNK